VEVTEVREYFMQLEGCCSPQPEWIVERLRRLYGIEVDPVSAHAALRVPPRIEFGPRLLRELPQ
jgi:hypothetical protein